MIVPTEITSHPARGRIRLRLEAIERRLLPGPTEPIVASHPLPDLTGTSPEAIAVGLVETITAAHGSDPLWGIEAHQAAGHGLCPLCLATLAEAVELAKGGVGPAPWPDPLLWIFDDEFRWRVEMERWGDRPEAMFDHVVWAAEQDRMLAEHDYADPYRGQIPPWVTLTTVGVDGSTR